MQVLDEQAIGRCGISDDRSKDDAASMPCLAKSGISNKPLSIQAPDPQQVDQFLKSFLMMPDNRFTQLFRTSSDADPLQEFELTDEGSSMLTILLKID